MQIRPPDWVTIRERRAATGDPGPVELILLADWPVARRICRIIDLLLPARGQRVRNREDGDEIDINAAGDAMIALCMSGRPDPRITMRNVAKQRHPAVTGMLDLSESTSDPIEGSDRTATDLTREAAALDATAIAGTGDPFAVDGFAFAARHGLHCYRVKDFAQGSSAAGRLAGMKDGFATRMGGAPRRGLASAPARTAQAHPAGDRRRARRHRRARPSK